MSSTTAPSETAPSGSLDRVVVSKRTPAAVEAAASRGKKLVRVRKDRDGPGEGNDVTAGNGAPATDAPAINITYRRAARKAGLLYAALLLLRLGLALTPGVLEPAEAVDGVPALAEALLPGMAVGAAGEMPLGMRAVGVDPRTNYTRSIVGAFVSSGVPYMAVNVACRKIPGVGPVLCAPDTIGYVALFAPRLWMFLLSLLGDVMLVRVFSVYESEHAVNALLAYASSWMALLIMTRNSNFVIEALCLLGLLCGCFGWTYQTPLPLFVLSGFSLALGVFLRPVFAVFVATPLIYLVSLWGKQGVNPIRYAQSFLVGIAVFGVWATAWITVDSIFYGFFKLRFGETEITSFDMFVDRAVSYITQGAAAAGGPLSYKGSLVYVPVNACHGIFSKAFWTEILRNTSPGQIFLHLPVVLGPLCILLIRESILGLKSQAKELMQEVKNAAGDKKNKKRKSKKSNISKEREEELLVYFDTVQTTFLLGLLLEVMQSNDRIGVLSLVFLNAPGIICLAPHVFGPTGSSNARLAHLGYTAAMVTFYGLLHHSGITRALLVAGAGGVLSIPKNADLVLYRANLAHPSLALGANVKGVHVHDGGQDRLALMTTLRNLKSRKGYDEERLLIGAAGTINMKESEFELVDKLAVGHMSLDDMPSNLDSALSQARLHLYKFTGDENEAIIRDDEEAADEEERERERKLRKDEL